MKTKVIILLAMVSLFIMGAQSQAPSTVAVSRYAAAWIGGSEAAASGEGAAVQITCGGAGGCWIDEIWMSSATNTGWKFTVSLAGTDPFSADALAGAAMTKQELRAVATTSTVVKGTTTVALAATDPTLGAGVVAGAPAGWPLHPFYIPNGALLSVKQITENIISNWAIRWREVL